MSLLDDVSIVVTPNGYKAGELYAVVPVPTEGAEEVTNGDFATDSDWSKAPSGVTISGGSANFNLASDTYVYQDILTATKTYKITFSGTINSGSLYIGENGIATNIYTSGTYTNEVAYFTVSSSSRFIIRRTGVGTLDATIDNVSVKEYTSADMDVTRATAATRVDEDGLVNYAEIIGSELVTNGDFELNSDWNNFGTPTTSEQSTEQSHTGTYSWKVIADATLEGIYSPNNFSLTSGLQYTVSLWVYSVSGTSIKSGLNNTNVSVFTVRTVTAGQWTNITYEATATSTGASYISILSENSLNFYVDNVSVKEIIRDNVPRIDYTGGGCPHILAEPQRTNLVDYSSDFSNAAWTKSNSTIDSNATVSPDGTENASKLTVMVAAYSGIYETGDAAVNKYSMSVFAKKGDKDWLYFVDGNGTTLVAWFNISDGTLGTITNGTATIEDFGNGWYRCIYSDTNNVSNVYFQMGLSDANNSYTPSSGGYAYIWGASKEVGSYPTSYIPTSGSTVTRNQDIFTRDGIGSLINSTEGVLFVEMAAFSESNLNSYITIGQNTSNGILGISFYTGSNNILLDHWEGASETYHIESISDVTEFNKIAICYDGTSIKGYINGSPVWNTTVTAWSSNALSELNFAFGNSGTNKFLGKVKQLQVYNTALTDEQLLQLTGESGTDFYESYAEMAAALTYTIQ